MFKHFLITRFKYDKDYPFLKQRMDIFNRFTLPSIEAQTNKNFTWIILGECDVKSDKVDIRIVNNLPEALVCDSDYVITSRIDNDDMLHPMFIEDVQNEFSGKQIAIDFRGYRYNLQTKEHKIFDYYHETKTSPFISLIQRNCKIGNGVMKYKHGEISAYYNVKVIDKYRWCQIIHEHNKLMSWKDGAATAYRETTEQPFA